MPYSSDHRLETKAKIIKSARRLFNRFGFDRVTIEQIMEDAGLTHGGFYRHFASKGDLYAEVLDCFFTNPDWDCGWEGADVDPAYGQLGPQIVRTYLSRAHFDDIENACPMVALPSDVARGGTNARKAYQTAFEAMVDILQQGSQNDAHPNRKSALAIAALCIGGMVIARASDDAMLADELREAAMTVALQLGGWETSRQSESGAVVGSK
jgi:AcrR family transcriptional regulator